MIAASPRLLLKPLGHVVECCLQLQAAEDREDWQQAMLGPLVDGSALAQLDLVTGSDALKTMQVLRICGYTGKICFPM
jgi:hypothetical protein